MHTFFCFVVLPIAGLAALYFGVRWLCPCTINSTHRWLYINDHDRQCTLCDKHQWLDEDPAGFGYASWTEF